MACEEFMQLDFYEVPDRLATSFKRSPVCASYVAWDADHPDAVCGEKYDPPGVFNEAGFGGWSCCGPCALDAGNMSILYFPTTTYDGCPITTPFTFDANYEATNQIYATSKPGLVIDRALPSTSEQYAIVDGSTL